MTRARDRLYFSAEIPDEKKLEREAGGPLFIREIIKVLDAIDVTEDERKKLYHLNAERMLKLKP